MKQAEETCCNWTLLFCIGTGPDLVRMHLSTLRNAGRIRQLGRQLQAAALAVASSVQGGMPWLQAAQAAQAAQEAAAAPPPGGQGADLANALNLAPPAQGGKWQLPGFIPAAGPRETAEREQEVFSHSSRLCAMPAKIPMEVFFFPQRGSEEMLCRPCVDCGLITGRFCDWCYAQDRDPNAEWAAGQLTPLCSKCDWKHGRCHYCRGLSWATPPPHP